MRVARGSAQPPAVSPAPARLGLMYRALYAFRSAEPNALAFAAGETFLVLERSSAHWVLFILRQIPFYSTLQLRALVLFSETKGHCHPRASSAKTRG